VPSAEAKLCKGGVKFRTAGKQSQILASSFLSDESPYPNHGSGATPRTQGVLGCTRCGDLEAT